MSNRRNASIDALNVVSREYTRAHRAFEMQCGVLGARMHALAARPNDRYVAHQAADAAQVHAQAASELRSAAQRLMGRLDAHAFTLDATDDDESTINDLSTTMLETLERNDK